MKEVKKYSRVYEERKQERLNKIFRLEEGDPMRELTFEEGTVKPIDVTRRRGTRRRSGQPRTTGRSRRCRR